ncbi:MAG TPA: peptidoglycan DD-metalloendopeptidase family protein, partial [Balneolaceae bacterium]|nr:peptidoglycan DD-metalloendopeptidase family protein [Balneolaceae bacterium]
AYKFKHGEFDGYFDQDGNSVQKALLKTPFKYDYRISSHFSHNRLNPVTHKHMPHTGTDYAAPKGTPVRATGDGVVIRAGYAGAAGNMVKIRHNSTYKTAYMHMNRFASGIRKGVHVKQGQVIGYVGSTGRSTGYHLHYSVYKNGTAVNSLTLELPSSRSVPDNLMDEFKKERNRLNKKLKKQKTKLVLKRTPSK